VWQEHGLRIDVCSPAQVKALATSMAVYCQKVAFVPWPI
jgi:hypothetical protein